MFTWLQEQLKELRLLFMAAMPSGTTNNISMALGTHERINILL